MIGRPFTGEAVNNTTDIERMRLLRMSGNESARMVGMRRQHESFETTMQLTHGKRLSL